MLPSLALRSREGLKRIRVFRSALERQAAAFSSGDSKGQSGGDSPSLDVGDRLTTSRTFTEGDVSLFARLSGDGNPSHQRRQRRSGSFSASTSPPPPPPPPPPSPSTSSVLVPGLLTASLFPGLIGTAIPGSVYLSQSLRFSAPLKSGEEVEARVEVLSKKVLPFRRVASSSSSGSSASGLLELLQMERKSERRRGGGGEGGGDEEESSTTTTKKSENPETPPPPPQTLPTSFVRAKLSTRAWKSGKLTLVVEGEAEALWPVY